MHDEFSTSSNSINEASINLLHFVFFSLSWQLTVGIDQVYNEWSRDCRTDNAYDHCSSKKRPFSW